MGTRQNRLAESISNEYPQHMFLWRIIENYPLIIIKYPPYLFFCDTGSNLAQVTGEDSAFVWSVFFSVFPIVAPPYTWHGSKWVKLAWRAEKPKSNWNSLWTVVVYEGLFDTAICPRIACIEIWAWFGFWGKNKLECWRNLIITIENKIILMRILHVPIN